MSLEQRVPVRKRGSARYPLILVYDVGDDRTRRVSCRPLCRRMKRFCVCEHDQRAWSLRGSAPFARAHCGDQVRTPPSRETKHLSASLITIIAGRRIQVLILCTGHIGKSGGSSCRLGW